MSCFEASANGYNTLSTYIGNSLFYALFSLFSKFGIHSEDGVDLEYGAYGEGDEPVVVVGVVGADVEVLHGVERGSDEYAEAAENELSAQAEDYEVGALIALQHLHGAHHEGSGINAYHAGMAIGKGHEKTYEEQHSTEAGHHELPGVELLDLLHVRVCLDVSLLGCLCGSVGGLWWCLDHKEVLTLSHHIISLARHAYHLLALCLKSVQGYGVALILLTLGTNVCTELVHGFYSLPAVPVAILIDESDERHNNRYSDPYLVAAYEVPYGI